MTKERPPRSLFRLFRRTVTDPHVKPFHDEQALWLAYDRALTNTRETIDSLGKMMASLSKQRAAVDAVMDRAGSADGRLIELAKLQGREAQTLDRLGLVALNAGLEAARLGEVEGRALGLVGEEVRAQVEHGQDSAREQSTRFDELRVELNDLQGQLGRVRDGATDALSGAAAATASASATERTLAEVRERVKKATGSDPETMRAIGEAAEHARALVGALGTLSGVVPKQLLVASLRPVLEPLIRLLFDDDESASEA
jgi:hypothetical protein